VTGLQRPDFQAIVDFRKRHESILPGLFKQVLRLSCRMGLTRLGSLTLYRKPANASTSKTATTRKRSTGIEATLSAAVRGWFTRATQADRQEARTRGAGETGDAPGWLADRNARRARIREARAALEAGEPAEIAAPSGPAEAPAQSASPPSP
jgi:hypothetical protein